MASLFHRKMNGQNKAGAAKDPEQGEKGRLHTGSPLHRTTEIRRASEQTSPPGGARSWTPSDGTDGGSGSGSSPIRPFHFRARQRGVEEAGTAMAEAFRGEFYQKVDARRGSRSRRPFAAFWKPMIPTSPRTAGPRLLWSMAASPAASSNAIPSGADALADRSRRWTWAPRPRATAPSAICISRR